MNRILFKSKGALFFSENRYFKDQDHLNTLGGTLFSKEIKVRLRKNELR
ncbi:MAG: hypothetical protein ACI8ZM_005657 [Crocinitomix sp.]|jgi:hypothetical protein